VQSSCSVLQTQQLSENGDADARRVRARVGMAALCEVARMACRETRGKAISAVRIRPTDSDRTVILYSVTQQALPASYA
jgi:hypothetical protein